ncbi:preprotein translocase subunit SecY [Acetobacterium paludosum]|uniref:Protein translocase subunit SecY n=1 Tax=Acetobacterium paludosum TaxID=52693 RepID=A0A923I458_9FIRM|nr:preprotein translocase subunit SecY [Acetobacterium paludosum]MBC3888735.1 preprotein translocase subunit SecY [Acetobacterium paludosum]
MVSTLKDAWKIPDLRRKILFTLALLFVYRLGSFIPIPFIDLTQLSSLVNGNGMFGLFNIISGGNFGKFTIFAMSITPYINASIIMNLLAFAIPALEKLQKEGEEGRKKLAQYTRFLTILLAIIQALGISLSFGDLLTEKTTLTVFTVVLCITAGTAFLMYLGEQITENGIGNGISLIIFVSIISRIPSGISEMYNYITIGTMTAISLILFLVFIVVVVFGVVAVNEGQRRVPVQYAKRVVGRKMYGGQSTHIPLRVNMAGVIPVIFASSLTLFPATISSFFPSSAFANWVTTYFAWGSVASTIIYVVLIIAFTYFYTAVTFNPYDVADNIKKQGGYVPGIRPGKPTVDYLSRITNRLTLFGGAFLAIIAIIPIFVGDYMGVNLQFGGTSLLIVVGVALEVVKTLESEMMMRHHQGFLKS